MVYKLNELIAKEIIPGFKGKFIHGKNSTLSFWEVEAGSILPEHSHHHEQTTQILEGKFKLTLAGDEITCVPGTVVVIPANTPHKGEAITACKILDTFSPVREEYN